MSDIPIVCPSAGRSHKVLTKRIIPEGLILCVPEAEAGLYEKHNPTCEIVAHPDSIIGLAPKRQWIIERWPSVFMVDDDITHVADAGRGEGEPSKIPTEMVVPLIQRTANTAEQMGVHLFGFNLNPNPITFRPQRPFRLTGVILGHALGVLEGHKLWFNPHLTSVSDFWIGALNAYYHRTVFVDLRYAFAQQATFRNTGGLARHRTLEDEARDTAELRRYFGPIVRKRGRGFKGVGTRRHGHEHQRTIRIPF